MVKEIHRETLKTIESWSKKIKQFSVKLVSFVIACWLFAGAFGLGVVAPVYFVRSVMSFQWTKEAQAEVLHEEKKKTEEPVVTMTAISNRWKPAEIRHISREPVKNVRPVTMRSQLHESGDSVYELRRIVRGLKLMAV